MKIRETITLDARTQQRLIVLTHVLAGELDPAVAAQALELSKRQVHRLTERLRTEGAAGLVHGNRGRTPANRTNDDLRSQVVEAASGSLAGFNPVHMSECLAEADEPIEVSARTVRRILVQAGLRPPRTRRRSQRHDRRERMAQAGILLQTDGSTHDWLEDRGPRLTLVGGIDDATSAITGATFRAAEDAAGYFLMLTETVRTHGLPLALYTDRAGIFIKETNRPPTLAEQLAGRRSLTQVGRALAQAGIGWIGAGSPQAKGRVERLWGTLQDRLLSELRRAKVDSAEGANALLAWYLPRHNDRFGVPAAIETPAWRPWSSEVPPEAVFCFHYRRAIEADATVSWPGGSLALPARADGRAWGRGHVVVEERLDGSLWTRAAGKHYELAVAPPDAPLLRARGFEIAAPVEPELEPVRPPERETIPSAHSTTRPAPTHPWRRYPAVRPR
jgi:transposase InsO family protein